MLTAKLDLERYIENKIYQIVFNTELCQGLYDYVNTKYDMPRGLASDFITMRMSLSEASEYVLFCLLDGIANSLKLNDVASRFYTEQEIKTYSNAKFEDTKIKFPLRFKVIEIESDHWTGKITIKDMMKLRAAQLINYNVNAQRMMQKIIKGDKEYYKIFINQANVNAITELYKKNVYIPTPFTLNIPQDSNADFYYDSEKCELVIKSLDHFDINDGYHRYIAACKVSDLDPNFDYNMELRIVNFSDVKSKQFIWQQDQKTKMKKVDSNSLNMESAANIILTRVNENPNCNMRGLIGRNQGSINFGEFADLLHHLLFKGKTKEIQNAAIIDLTKELINFFNLITEHDKKYLETYSYKQLCAVTYLFVNYRHNPEFICNVIDEVVEKTESLDNKKFYSRVPKKSIFNDIERIVNLVKDVN